MCTARAPICVILILKSTLHTSSPTLLSPDHYIWSQIIFTPFSCTALQIICTNHIIFTRTPSSSNFSSSLACLFMSFLQAQLSRSCLRPLRHLDDDDDDNEQLCCWEYSENIHTDHGPGGKHKGQMTEKTRRRRSRPGHPSMTVTLKTQGRNFGHPMMTSNRPRAPNYDFGEGVTHTPQN